MFIRFKRYQRVKNKSLTSLCLSIILPRDKALLPISYVFFQRFQVYISTYNLKIIAVFFFFFFNPSGNNIHRFVLFSLKYCFLEVLNIKAAFFPHGSLTFHLEVGCNLLNQYLIDDYIDHFQFYYHKQGCRE